MKNNNLTGAKNLPIDGKLDLLKGIYNRIQKDYGIKQQGFGYQLMLMHLRVPDWEHLLHLL